MAAPVPIISLPEFGLTTADIGLRLYRYGVVTPLAELAGVTLGLTAQPLDYTLNGLPDAGGDLVSATWTRSGQSSAYEYGVTGAPVIVVLPVREVGHDATSLALRIYRDGTEVSGIAWTVEAIGNDAEPDYRVSGWPTDNDGSTWVLLWEYAGQVIARTWSTAAPLAVGTATPEFDFPAEQADATQMIAGFAGGLLSTLRHNIRVRENGVQITVSPLDYRVYAVSPAITETTTGTGDKVASRLVYMSASGIPEDVPERPDSNWELIDPTGRKNQLDIVKPFRPDMVTTIYYEVEVAL